MDLVLLERDVAIGKQLCSKVDNLLILIAMYVCLSYHTYVTPSLVHGQT